MKIREFTALPAELTGEFWALYEAAFAPLATRAAARQLLTRDEFIEEMADARVVKYVAYDDADEAVGLMTLTSDLATVPWVSPQYYAARYPEHAARDAIFYMGFTLVKPIRARNAAWVAMSDTAMAEIVKHDAVVVYDICKFNVDRLRFDKAIERVMAPYGWFAEKIDVQSYYAAVFTAAPAS